MQFTKPVIAFVSLVIFATTFLPRHWWHHCDHAHTIENHCSDASEHAVTLRAEDCPICSLVIPWFTSPAQVTFDRIHFTPRAHYISVDVHASASEEIFAQSGRAPPGRV